MQHTNNHTDTQTLTHTYALTIFFTHINLTDVKILEKGIEQTLK